MSTVKANDLMKVDGGIPTVKGQQLIPTAWVNFNGTSTVAIRGSEGVSSITDNGTGNYSVNFSTNMANTNYSTVTNGARLNNQYVATHYGNQQVSKVIIVSYTINSQSGADTDTVAVVILGGQA